MYRVFRNYLQSALLLLTGLMTGYQLPAQQVSLTTLGTAYTQNFDAPPLPAAAGSFVNGTTINGWYLSEPGKYNGQNDGSGAAFGFYGYGSSGGADWALGSFAGSAMSTGYFGVVFQNNTGQTITCLRINYRGEQWSLPTSTQTNAQNALIASIRQSATAINNVTSGTWTAQPSLNFDRRLSDNSGCTNVTSSVDGNTSIFFSNIAASITVSIAPGEYFAIRWQDNDEPCSDPGLAVDNFSLVPYSTPPTPTSQPATNITCNGFTANWNTVTAATGYIVDVSTNATFTAPIAGSPFMVTDVVTNFLNITGLAPGTTYYYRVRATNPCSQQSANSNSVAVTTLATPIAPSPPLPASNIGCTNFTANWVAVTGASGYLIEVATSCPSFTPQIPGSPFTVIGGSTTSLLITGLSPGTNYCYRVKATNACGDSPPSAATTATTTALPAAPTALAANPIGCLQFTANWAAVAGATSYRLDVSTDPGFGSFVTGYNNLTVATVSQVVSGSGIVLGGTYYYRVRALSTCGTSVNSNVITVKTDSLPVAPAANPATDLLCNQFTANWSSVSRATGYQLDVATNASFSSPITGSPFTISGGSTVSQVVTGLNPGITYYYRVRATNACGSSSNSGIQAAVTLATPSAPPGLNANPVNCVDFTASWNTVSGAARYYIDVSADGFSTFLPSYNNQMVMGTSVAVTGLTEGTSYCFRVRAENICGLSPNSTAFCTTTKALPSPPSVSPATAIGCSTLTANWTAVTGATGYFLDVDDNSDFSSPIITGLSVSGTSHVVSGLNPGTTYYYRVRARNDCGSSVYSGTRAEATAPRPNTPAAGTASGIGCDRFTANWGTVTGVSGYDLEVATDAGFTTPVAGSPFSISGSSSSSFIVTGLIPNSTYYYRVRAIGLCVGDYTAAIGPVATLTTPLPPATSSATVPVPLDSCVSFQANWGFVAGATEYRVDVATDAGFTAILGSYNNIATVATQLQVFGLVPGQTYYYRVRAINACGASINSAPAISITTKALPAVPVALPATDVSCTGFQANWSQGAGGGTLTNFQLDVATSPFFTPGTFLTGYNGKIIPPGTTSEVLTGLSIGSTYYYRLRATNACGNTAYSSVVSVTLDNIPTVPAVNPASPVGCTDFTANWTAITGAQYRVDVATDAAFTSLVPPYIDILQTTNSLNVTGLAPGNTYYYRVRAVNTCGTSVNSATQSVSTLGIPAAVTALSATLTGCVDFTANWTANPLATGYEVDVATDLVFSSFVPGYFSVSTTGTSLNVSGLTASTAYFYRVRAVNACGSSANSNTIQVNTVAIPPVPTAANPDPICPGLSVTLTASGSGVGAQYLWYDSDAPGGTLVATGADFTTPPINTTTTYWVAAVANNCTTPTRRPVTVATSTILTAPTVSGNTILCSGQQTTLTISAPAAGTFFWYRDDLPSGSLFFVGNSYTTSALSGDTVLWVQTVVGSCSSTTRTSVHIQISPTPSAPVVNAPAFICAGQSAVLIASGGAAGAIYNWYSSASAAIPFFTGGVYSSSSLIADSTYYVSAVLGGCEGPRRAVLVDVRPDPVIAGTVLTCPNRPVSLSVSGGGAGAIYQWFQSPTAGTPFYSGATYTTTPLTADSIFYIQLIESGCTSQTRQSLLVDVTPGGPPPPSFIGGVVSCQGDRAVITATGGGATGVYLWYTAAGGGAPFFTGSTYVSTNLMADTTFWVATVVSGCTSTTRAAAAIQVPPPTPTATVPSQTLPCPGQQVTFTPTGPAGASTFLWYQSVSAAAPFYSGSSYQTSVLSADTTIYVAAVVGGCTSLTRNPATVNVIPAPAAPTVSTVPPFCSGQTALLTPTSALSGSFAWYTDSVGASPFFIGSSYITAPLVTDTVIWVATISGSCTSDVRSAFRIPVFADPAVVGDYVVCSGGQVTITPSLPSSTVSFAWYSNLSAATPFYTGQSYTTSALTADTVIYVASIEGGCTSIVRRSTAVRLINSVPPGLSPTVTACFGNTATINLSGGPVNASYLWFTSATAGTAFFTGTSYTTSPVRGDTVIWVATALPGCTATTRSSILVQVQLLPVPPTLTNLTPSICAGSRATIQASGSGAGALYGWFSSPSGGSAFYVGSTYTTTPLPADTVFYVSSVRNGCLSPSRTSILVPVGNLIEFPIARRFVVCVNNRQTITPQLSVPNPLVGFVYFRDSVGNNMFYSGSSYTTGLLVSDTTIWVASVLNGCTSTVRIPMTVQVVPYLNPPIVPAVATTCIGERVTIQAKTDLPGTRILWYRNNIPDNVPFYEGNNYTTGFLSRDTTLWLATVSGSCTSASRSSVAIDVVDGGIPPAFDAIDAICAGERAILRPRDTIPGAAYYWYNGVSRVPLFIGTVFETAPLFDTTRYYVSMLRAPGCTQTLQVEVKVNVRPAPTVPLITSGARCAGERDTLRPVSAIPAGMRLLFYTDQLSETPFYTGDEYITSPLFADTSIWVACELEGCRSLERVPVRSKIFKLANAPKVNAVPVCRGSSTWLEVLNPEPETRYIWYDNAIGGNALDTTVNFETSKLFDSTYFWVSAIKNGCETGRMAVRVPLRVLEPPVLLNQPVTCLGGDAILQASAPSGTVSWWRDTSDLAPILTFDTLLVDRLYGADTVWMRADDGFCHSYFVQVPLRIVEKPYNLEVVTSNRDTIGVNVPVLVAGKAEPAEAALTWDFGIGARPRYAQGPGPHAVSFFLLGKQTIRLRAAVGSCAKEIVREFFLTPTSREALEQSMLSLRVYPNPARQQLMVSWGEVLTEPVTVMMLDMAGRVVMTKKVSSGIESTVFALESLSSGVYVLQVSAEGYMPQSVRIVKE